MAPETYKSVDWSQYELLSDDAPVSLTWASRGGDGSGKSYFGCTAPGPIFVCGFDPHGMSRVSKEVRAGKEIRIGRYGFNSGPYGGDRKRIADAAEAVWIRFVTDYREALKHFSQSAASGKQRGTVLWDREDLAWELLRKATFGGDKNEGSRTGALDYGDLNAEYVSLIQEAKAAGVNLGLLQGLTDNWVAKFDPAKAKMVNYQIGSKPDGFKKVADHVDITLDHRWDPEQKEYVAKLIKFPEKGEKDKEYANLSFGDMAILAFPETSKDDWGVAE